MRFVTLSEFSAKYDGPALEDHQMDVTYLGAALLGLGEMFREAQQAIDPLGDKQPKVKVKEVRPGSFEVVLGIDYSLIDQATNLFNSPKLTAAGNAAGLGSILIGTVATAVKGVKKLAAKKQVNADELIAESGDELIGKSAEKLVRSKKFRKNVAKLSKPVTEEGIDEMRIRDKDGDSLVEINEDEAIEIQELDETLEPLVRYETAIVEIGTPQIDKPLERKWGITHQDYGAINARLLDVDFASAVAKRKVLFGKGLRFKARLRIEEKPQIDGDTRYLFEIVTIAPVEDGTQTEISIT